MEGSVPVEFEYDSVPNPPPTPFTHVVSNDPRMAPVPRERVAPEPLPLTEGPPYEPPYEEPYQAQPQEPPPPLNKVLEGEYCVFVSGNLLFSTPSLDEAEDALNRLIFSDTPVPVDEVVVMRRLSLKIGASIG
jgi:hypothetical protein